MQKVASENVKLQDKSHHGSLWLHGGLPSSSDHFNSSLIRKSQKLVQNPTQRMMLSVPLPLFQAQNPNPKTFHCKPNNWKKPIFQNSRNYPPIHHVSLPGPTTKDDNGCDEGEVLSPSSAAALAVAILRASPNSPVEFTQRLEKKGKAGLVLPSPDFHRICVEQLDLFRMVVHHDAILSVFVRPPGSYAMDQLELCRVTFYPGIDLSENADCVILVGNFAVPAGLHAAEAALSKLQVDFVSDYRAVILPMVKHPFVVGFLVAELPMMEVETCEDTPSGEQHTPFCSMSEGSPMLPPFSDKRIWEFQGFKEESNGSYAYFTVEQKSKAIMICRTLAMAYVMDQKAMLLQQSSWQNNIRMSHLVEQIRGSLSSIRALSKMLSVHAKRSEISYDIVEDILMQGDHMKDTLQQLQDAVYLTKANIVQYNEDTLRRMHDSTYNHQESLKSFLPDCHLREQEENSAKETDSLLPLASERMDIEMPTPPLLLAPLQKHNIRPCIVSDVLKDLVGAAQPLATKQERSLQLREVTYPLHVAVEESALRQALSNLIEGALLRTKIGGRVEVYAAAAPAGGALVLIDDNGPDMHYMTQMHSLTSFGEDLLSDGQAEDCMTWNFVAGLAVAREILENYGCVVRVISPRNPDAVLSSRGTRVELWLPSLQPDSLSDGGEA